MGDQLKAFWLGIFILASVAVAAWLLLFLEPSVGDAKKTLHIRFANINNVSVGTRATFAGKTVGEVKSIQRVADFRQNPPDEYGNLYVYELILKVDSSVSVYSYDEIIYSSSGLLGEKAVAILPKASPPGAPPAYDVSEDILYARSTDTLQQTLNRILQVADSFEEMLDELKRFFETNTEDFNRTLKSLTHAANEVHVFTSRANAIQFIDRASEAADWFNITLSDAKEHALVERLGKNLDKIYTITNRIAQGRGALGQLLNDDCLLVQIRNLICKFETLLNDINNYGLLFQYNKKWQRKRNTRLKQKRYCSVEKDIQQLTACMTESIKQYTEILEDAYGQ
ncbi:MAG: MlaD family protein [Chlamydiales bacterium]